MPLGCLQGGGKSLAAKAVAGLWGVPLLRLDMGALYNKYHGETERNLREALSDWDARDLKAAKTPSLVVATPGRLNDLLYNHGVDELCAQLSTLVFDEADQLLEMGFRPSITKILQALQPCALTRQTLLFSATMPGDVLQVAQIATRKGAATKLIDTVGEETSTNTQVDQHVTLTTMANQPAELLALVGQLTAERPFKLVVFFVTARLTQLYAEATTSGHGPILIPSVLFLLCCSPSLDREVPPNPTRTRALA